MTTFTTAEATAATERLATEQQAVVEKLTNLEDHLGRKLLDSTTLEGVTRERRAKVLDEFATLSAQYERYRAVAVQVRAIMARPTEADLRAVESLMTEASALVAEIERTYNGIREVITATDEVWTAMDPRIDACETLLRQAQLLIENLGLAASQDPIAGVMTELTGRLDAVRRTALTDPLRFWADGAVAVREAEQLVAQCERVHADLQALAELRRHAARRLDQVSDTVTKVRRLEQETSAQRRWVSAKILSAPVPEKATLPTSLLSPRLATALELCRSEHWRQLASELQALERDVIAALTRAQSDLIEAGRPLQQRAELRGRLSAYRAKAAGLGRIEDLALEQRYQRARRLLWRAPCDLTVAAAAVADYLDAVNATAPTEGSP
jgi:hypothetical protein